MKKYYLLDVFLSFNLGIGLLLCLIPPLSYWWIHGDYDRYLWIINGPPPYNSFGGMAFQLYILGIIPFILGLLLCAISILIRKAFIQK